MVISSSAIGPRGPSFWVEMPISAQRPNWAPSVKLVGALTYTQAASICAWNCWAAAGFSVTMHSEWPEPFSVMCSIASSRDATVRMAS